jgi:hypothetical protein
MNHTSLPPVGLTLAAAALPSAGPTVTRTQLEGTSSRKKKACTHNKHPRITSIRFRYKRGSTVKERSSRRRLTSPLTEAAAARAVSVCVERSSG